MLNNKLIQRLMTNIAPVLWFYDELHHRTNDVVCSFSVGWDSCVLSMRHARFRTSFIALTGCFRSVNLCDEARAFALPTKYTPPQLRYIFDMYKTNHLSHTSSSTTRNKSFIRSIEIFVLGNFKWRRKLMKGAQRTITTDWRLQPLLLAGIAFFEFFR